MGFDLAAASVVDFDSTDSDSTKRSFDG